MTSSPAPADASYRYAAFISYRHAPQDRKWAVWLHRALEAYRVPKRLQRDAGLAPRVGRCFRDEDELPASADLSREIDAALEKSRFLIVVCSPRTPRSLWVNKEVERFRAMGRHDQILALLIDGEPGDSFPRALREIRRTVTEGGLTREQIEEVEPLAADVRPSRSERRGHLGRMARLRLLACVLGVPFDDLRQREQERRTRRLIALSSGLFALLAIFAAVSTVAVVQWRSARAMSVRALAGESAAVQQKGEADRQKADAQASARDARRRLVDLYARDGWSRVDAGDPSTGLLLFVRALESAAGDAPAETDARVRIATTLAVTPHVLDAPPGARAGEVKIAARSLKIDGSAVWIIDTATRRPVAAPLRHDDAVTSADFSPDGRRVVTTSGGLFTPAQARAWDAVTGQPLAPPLRHDNPIASAAFSPDGERIVTASGAGLDLPGEAWVWSATTGQLIAPPLRHDGPVNAAAFSPDGRRVVTGSRDKTARVWDAASGRLVMPPLRHDGSVSSVAFSKDGRRIVTACEQYNPAKARTWDALSGVPLAPAGHDDSNQPRLATGGGGAGASIRVWDAAVGHGAIPPLRHEGYVSTAAFTPDGQRVVTTGGSLGQSAQARVWDARTGAAIAPALQFPTPITAATFSADGARIVTVSGAMAEGPGDARVWDASTGRPLTPLLRHAGGVNCAAFSPDGRRVVTGSADKTARVWDATSGAPLTPPLQHEASVYFAAFSPDGARVVTASGEFKPAEARVWDAATGKPVTPPLVHDLIVTFAAFSPDGRHLVTASADQTARVWDATTGQPATAPLRHDASVTSAAFSPDGRRIVTASGDFGKAGEGRVWDAATGQPLSPPLRHASVVHAAAFSPDGRWVVTAGGGVGMPGKSPATGEARVWDAASGRPITPLLRHDRSIASVAFAPDGRRLVTASSDGTARVWDVVADTRPLAYLKALAELLACQRLDAADGLTPLTPAEWKARWDDLRKRYPADFRPHPDWTYEELNPPAPPPTTAPASQPSTQPAAESGSGG